MIGSPRDAVLDLPAYRPGRSAAEVAAEHAIADVIKLASNEVVSGPLPGVVAAIAEATGDANLYSDHRATMLRQAIAASNDVGVDRVTVGPGSVGLLQQLVLSYADPADAVAFCWPSFEAYPMFASLMGAQIAQAPLRRQSFDLPALADAVRESAAVVKLVLIANPNNPTGTAVGTDDLAAFVERVPQSCLVVIDEAYREFVTDSRVVDSVALVEQFDNVVVLRTFSKAYGLAALRVGYAIARPEVIDVIDRTLIPFVVNGIGQAAAIASLASPDELRARVVAVVAERSRVADRLRRSGWMVPEPQGNFVWLPAGRSSIVIGVELERLGVVTRVFSDVGVRVTIADQASNDRFLDAFHAVSVNLDAVEWGLPTGDLARRVADELTQLDVVGGRLRQHAESGRTAGFTDPDEPTGERWDEGQLWAHLAEFGAYWRRELHTIVDAVIDGPVPFGRTKRDPHRRAMIESGRNEPIDRLHAAVVDHVAAFRADLAEMTTADWSRRGIHETLGEMDLWAFLGHFVTGHYREHADQLDGLVR